MKQPLVIAFVAMAALFPVAGYAAKNVPAPAAASAGAPSAPLVDGQVKKINKATGKVTLAHGPIPNIGMPAMTMVFKLKDPAWIDQLKEGDRIRFVGDEVKGELMVMRFEPAR